jgi:hypothetical protein
MPQNVDDILHVRDLRRALESGGEIMLECNGRIATRHGQLAVILMSGLINWRRKQAVQRA